MAETSYQKHYRGQSSHRKVKSSPMTGNAKRKGFRMVKSKAKSYHQSSHQSYHQSSHQSYH